ncbi:glycosyltransferase family 9 protein [Georgenia sp. EYE_87]|uniref:glycosyltransferase family 9 protein n=1 Tax=Georgenia sp. EYE_87 TaxID=2853448 RepID=UPI002004B034|nr:glycosyltransferase family 9 protein [Georgenia sp. EYE_87]MCK6211172.1 glycosyltransferase family 9 protein [Georgenia sp. EYE_87]
MTPRDDGPAGDVLVLRALGLGDTLTAVPALRGLRRAFPGRRLVLAGPAAPGGWLRELGVVDEVLPTSGLDAPLRWERPGGHVAVNLHGRGPQSHQLLSATGPSRLVAFGCPEVGHPGPPWVRDEHEVDRWCRLVRSAGGDCSAEDLRLPAQAGAERGRGPAGDGRVVETEPVVVHPGAASLARRWPAERWTAVARALATTGHPVVLTGSGDEVDVCRRIARAAGAGVHSVAGSLDLPALAERVGTAGLLVCGDTGVAHLATALGTPSVVLFGPTPPTWWGPAIDHHLHTVVWHGTGPCDPHAVTVDPALAEIGVDEVVEAARDLLETTTARTTAPS